MHNATAQGKLALAQAYRKTTYAADIAGVTYAIRIGRLHRKLDAQLEVLRSTRWAFVTAWNPQSQRLSARVNRQRHALLTQALDERRIRWHPMHATGDAGDWPTEEGVMALGLSRTAARRLGKEFEQAAVVFGRVGEKAELVWT